MRKSAIAASVLFLVCFMVSPAEADDIVLQDWTINVNGNSNYNCLPIPCTPNTPPFLDFSAFDLATGLGTISGVYNPGTGTFILILYLDHDITGPNNPVDNELGAAVGTPNTFQTWEIDEPGFTTGQLLFDVLNGTLTNSAWPSGTTSPNDVGMALGFVVTLANGEVVQVSWTVSTTAPSSGFYLEQYDPVSGQTLYFSGDANIRQAIPEPATALLVLTGLGLAGVVRRRFQK